VTLAFRLSTTGTAVAVGVPVSVGIGVRVDVGTGIAVSVAAGRFVSVAIANVGTIVFVAAGSAAGGVVPRLQAIVSANTSKKIKYFFMGLLYIYSENFWFERIILRIVQLCLWRNIL
jgi:hypothetical protein